MTWTVSSVPLFRAAYSAFLMNLCSQPAIKLLEFFRGISSVDTAARKSGRKDVEGGGSTIFVTVKSQAASPTMQAI